MEAVCRICTCEQVRRSINKRIDSTGRERVCWDKAREDLQEFICTGQEAYLTVHGRKRSRKAVVD
jgi:tRNA-dihydrouridine synthase